MDNEWICVFITGYYYQALFARECLYDQDIESVIVNKQDSTYLFGDVEIFVRQNDVIKAKHILKTSGIE